MSKYFLRSTTVLLLTWLSNKNESCRELSFTFNGLSTELSLAPPLPDVLVLRNGVSNEQDRFEAPRRSELNT